MCERELSQPKGLSFIHSFIHGIALPIRPSHDNVIRIETPGFGAGGADVRSRHDVLNRPRERGREGGMTFLARCDVMVKWIANHYYCY